MATATNAKHHLLTSTEMNSMEPKLLYDQAVPVITSMESKLDDEGLTEDEEEIEEETEGMGQEDTMGVV